MFDIYHISYQDQWIVDVFIMCWSFQPEGTAAEYSTSAFLHLTQDQPGPYMHRMDIELPQEGLVAGSEYVKITAIGACAFFVSIKMAEL